jgi:PIN domain nuclease of toxin-antitoxin system
VGVVLLDTHALLWWFADDPALSPVAKTAIQDTNTRVLVSAASGWEIATKVRIGKLPTGAELASNFEGFLEQAGFEGLPISVEDGVRAGALPGPHKDPFDRMLIAQAQSQGIPIVSNEEWFDLYGVRRVW